MTPLFDFNAVARSIDTRAPERIPVRHRAFQALFATDVVRAGWTLLQPVKRLNIPGQGRAIVIAVVLWSSTDRELLREAASLLRDRANVFVFDLDAIVAAREELGDFLPDVPLQVNTPIVAEYVDGALKRVGAGARAREVVAGGDTNA